MSGNLGPKPALLALRCQVALGNTLSLSSCSLWGDAPATAGVWGHGSNWGQTMTEATTPWARTMCQTLPVLLSSQPM